MTDLNGSQRAILVRRMFGRIAGRYDLLNRVMTLGRDRVWRRAAVDRLELSSGARVLDLGSGTGALTFEILRRHPQVEVVAADFTRPMIREARRRSPGRVLNWVIADALHLPFPDGTFSGLISGFLLRNVADLPTALQEQLRVLKPGGRWVSLETAPPADSPLKPLAKLHLDFVIPALGAVLAGDLKAYRYLPASTAGFHTPEALAELLASAGLRRIHFERRMLGTIAVHWGDKP